MFWDKNQPSIISDTSQSWDESIWFIRGGGASVLGTLTASHGSFLSLLKSWPSFMRWQSPPVGCSTGSGADELTECSTVKTSKTKKKCLEDAQVSGIPLNTSIHVGHCPLWRGFQTRFVLQNPLEVYLCSAFVSSLMSLVTSPLVIAEAAHPPPSLSLWLPLVLWLEGRGRIRDQRGERLPEDSFWIILRCF